MPKISKGLQCALPKIDIIQNGIACGRVLKGELYAQRLQKLIYRRNKFHIRSLF